MRSLLAQAVSRDGYHRKFLGLDGPSVQQTILNANHRCCPQNCGLHTGELVIDHRPATTNILYEGRGEGHTSGKFCKTATSAACLERRSLDGECGAAARQDIWTYFRMPPWSLAICNMTNLISHFTRFNFSTLRYVFRTTVTHRYSGFE